MRRHAVPLLTFLLLTAVLIVVLKLIDRLPGVIEPGGVRRYASLAEAQSKLGIRKVYVPAYFPKTLEWPPSRVLAQSRPFEAVVVEFRRVDSTKVGLVITQASSPRLKPEPTIHLKRIRQTSSVDLKGRQAVVVQRHLPPGVLQR